MSAQITTEGRIALSQAELAYLQSLLNAGDRPGFYMAYYNMTGSEQAILQAQVSSFSEGTGGSAIAANWVLQSVFAPQGMYLGIYVISQGVAQNAMNAIRADAEASGGNGGFIGSTVMLDSAAAFWDSIGQANQFPGNPLQWLSHAIALTNVQPQPWWEDIWEILGNFVDPKAAAQELFTTGTLAAIASTSLGPALLGKRRSDYEDNPAYTITETPDGEWAVVTRNSDGHTVAVLQDDPFIIDSGAALFSALADVAGPLSLPALAPLLPFFSQVLREVRLSLTEGTPGFDGEIAPHAENPPFDPSSQALRPPTNGPDTIWGTDGFGGFLGADDIIDAGGGNDVVFGGDGEDNLSGGGGDDIVYGQTGDDLLFGGGGDDVLRGGAGDDIIEGGNDDDYLDGGDNNPDTISGDDILRGGDGIDTLRGGDGADVLDGGVGNDTYVYAPGDGVDVIINDSDGGVRVGTVTLTGQGAQRYSDTRWPLDPSWRWESNGRTFLYRLTNPVRNANGEITGGDLWIEGDDFEASDRIVILGYELETAYLGIDLSLDTLVAVLPGVVASNPFIDPAFSPAAASTTLVEGGSRTITVAWNAPAEPGQRIRISVDTLAANLRVAAGAGTQPFSGGDVLVTLSPGQNLLTFSLISTGDVDVDETITLTATLLDAGGAAIESSPNLAVAFDAFDEPDTTPGLTLNGDIAPNIDEDDNFIFDIGVTFGWFAGNVVDGTNSPGRADRLIGASGADVLSGLGGTDAINGRDGDDFIDGGDGADLLTGGRGADRIFGGEGDDLIMAGSELTPATKQKVTEAEISFIPGFELVGDGWNWYLVRQNGHLGPIIEYSFAAGASRITDDGADVVDAGAGNDEVEGGYGDDVLQGGDGNDLLYGGPGSDRLEGSAGADSLYGDVNLALFPDDPPFEVTLPAQDFLDGGAGDDLLRGNEGDDTLLGGEGDDTLVGDDASDALQGADFLDGGDGADTMWGSGAGDTLFGGAGDDSLDGDMSSLPGAIQGDDYVDGGSGADTLFGGGGSDTLLGGDDDDSLTGDYGSLAAEFHGDDYLDGGSGNDSLSGSGGSDRLIGGLGDDTLQGDASNTPDEVQGDDYLDGGDGADIMTGSGGADTLIGGAGNDSLDGDRSTISGEIQGDDYLDGGAGEDTLFGGGGADTLLGGDDNDSLTGDYGSLAAEFHGDDYLDGGSGDDSLSGGGGADTLIGGLGDDTLQGDASNTPEEVQGDDYLDGGAGNDTLTGRGGADTLLGGGGNDTLFGGIGDDVLEGGTGDDQLQGSDGDDRLVAGSGNDVLFGEGGDDFIEGNDGNDSLIGGPGRDTLAGGTGVDRYTYSFGDGEDTIRDSGTNTLRFNFPFLAAGFSLGIGSLRLSFTSSPGDVVHLEGWDADDPLSTVVIDRFEFDDRVMTYEQVLALGFDFQGTPDVDFLEGTGVQDRINALESDDTVIAKAGDDIIDGGSGSDYLLAGDGADQVAGGADDDLIFGEGGNDALDGGTGADEMLGGAGNDSYVVDNTGDLVTEQFGEGTDVVTSSITYTLTDNVENLTLAGAALDGSGNALANFIQGNAENNVLSGLDGDDVVLGWDGDDQVFGGAGVDSVQGGIGNDQVFGGEGNDFVIGGNDDDLLDGGTGADSMQGGAGNDTYVVDDFGDTVTEQFDSGLDTVQSSVTFALGADLENLTLIGTAAIDGIGNDLANAIIGNSGNNILNGLGGADTLQGGLGNDRYTIVDLIDVVIENAGEGTDTVDSTITYTLGANLENLSLAGQTAIDGTGNELANVLGGQLANNTLRGLAGNDTLIAGAGNDVLDGGADIDAMTGGTGNDTYIVDNAADTIIETSTSDFDRVESSVSYTLASTARVETFVLTGTAAINATGNTFTSFYEGNDANNVITANNSSSIYGHGGNDTLIANGNFFNQIDGGEGVDTMQGGGGQDEYWVDNTADTVVEAVNGGTDFVFASASYTLSENIESLWLQGADDIDGTGNALDNSIQGNDGANVLSGLGGADSISGGAGNDTIDGGDGNDFIGGGDGDDTVFGGAGNDNISDLGGSGVFSTGGGTNVLAGGAGDDIYTVGSNRTSEVSTSTVIENADEGYDVVKSAGSFVLGDNVEQLTLTEVRGSNGNPVGTDGTGNNGNNFIVGSAVRNTLLGLGGQDDIDGWAGNDTIFGGDGGDNIYGGNDEVFMGAEGSVYVPLENADTIDGGAGDDLIDGASGDDILLGGEGDDEIYGGDDGDGDGLTGAYLSNNDQIDGGAGDDFIYGDSGDDILLGGSGVDVIFGGGPGYANESDDDILDGGTGLDYMAGGEGDDTYYVDGEFEDVADPTAVDECGIPIEGATRRIWYSDLIEEFENEGYDVVYSSSSLELPDNIEEVQLVGTENIDATSGAGAQVLIGNSGHNRLDGGADADTLVGGLGNDTLVVDDALDEVEELADEGVDTIEASIDYTLGDNFENLTLTGGAVTGTGNAIANVLRGNAEANTLIGLGGNDELNGGAGDDSLQGGDGDDVYRFGIGSGVDTVTDTVGLNTVRLLGSLTGSDLTLTQSGNDLILSINGTTDQLILQGWAAVTVLASGNIRLCECGCPVDFGNDPPVAVDDVATVTEDGTLVATGNVLANDTDPDTGDVLSVANFGTYNGTYGTLVLGATGDYTYTLSNTLAPVQSLGQGETELDVFGYTAQDAQPLTDAADLTVSVHGANDLPVVATPIADQAGEEDAPFSFTVSSGTFTDIDRNDVLTYAANLADGSPLPAWLTFSPATRQFTGTPPAGAAGTYQVRVTATDLFAATANDVFALVIAQNDPTSDTLQFTADACWPAGSVSPSGVCIEGLKQTYGVYDGGAGVDTLVGTEDGDAILLEDEASPRPPGTSGPRIISVEIIDAAGGDDVVDLSSTLYTYGDVTVQGGAGSDTLIGGAGHNTLLGGEGCDTLTGGALGDVLDGGAGGDCMAGGLGDDAYHVDEEGDSVAEESDAGTETVYSSVSICLAQNVENLVLTGTAVFGEGNDLANTITGNASDNIIDGGCGADVLAGGAGDDVYYVDEAGDLVVENAGEGTDEIRSHISLALGANVENLTLLETDLCATATGNALANVLTGNSGDNVLDGAGGADTLVGGAGNDTYIVDVTGDVITELAGDGTDSVESSATYTLSANVENLTLLGTGNINGTGNAQANAITGNTGDNELTGGAGNDVLRGGAGADTYVFSAGAGHDVVQDTIELDANCNPAEDAATDVIRFDATITPADVVFSVSPTHAHALRIDITSTGDSITLQGFLAHDDVADRIEEFRFSDGTVWTAAQVLAGFSRIVGTESKDVLNAVAGGSLLYGLGDEDVLNGGAGNDVLDGGADCDVMTGGAGNDAYFVDNPDDETIEGTSGGTDTVYASIDWTLAANVENLTLDGDTWKGTGNTLANRLIGNSSSNELDGGAGADTTIGGTGDDTYVIDDVGDVVVENADEGWDHVHSTISYTLGANMEGVELIGTANVDAIGNAANNLLDGNSGNNLLDGGAGEDDLWGHAGNDTYIVDSEYDQVHESSNQGTDTVRSTVGWTLGSNVENLVLLGTAAINGTGNSLANVLTGNSASNELNGGGGADTMSGGAGDDTYTVNAAGDQVLENAGEGIDLVKSSVSFTLGSAVENLTLTGSAAVDGYGNALDNVLTGGGGANRLESYAGNDTLDGGGGDDTMIGGAGNDIYLVNTTGDVVTENVAEGFDTVNSSVGGSVAANIEALFLTGGSAVNVTGNSLDNFLRGNSAANTLTGGAGIDVLDGGAGADTLTDTDGPGLFFGGAGADTLTGSALSDYLAGGAGNDVINTGGGSDVIAFNRGDGKDTVNASAIADDTLSLGGGILYADLLLKESGNNLILITGSNEQLTFVDWYAGSGNHSVDALQVVIEGTADYDGLSSDPLRNTHVQMFDFESLVAEFDAARAANPSLTTWALTNALAQFHLSGSDTAAIGADLAYRYGRFGSLSDISFLPAAGILAANGFGSTAQALHSLAALQDASPRLS
jgi:trimeric autotransporter adhesin